MAITDWPEAERPREKLLARGPQALSDTELLAIFLRTGTPGKTAVDLARELLTHFGGLRPLLTADVETLCDAPGPHAGSVQNNGEHAWLCQDTFADQRKPLHDGALIFVLSRNAASFA